jgi:hypothetical protein
MRYIEVNAWGNKRKHLIPLNKIVDIEFGDDFTTITLTSSKTINVIESKKIIEDMLTVHNVKLVTEDELSILLQQKAYEDSL